MAVSTTGCVAVKSPENSIRVFHWYYRAKGRELIIVPHTLASSLVVPSAVELRAVREYHPVTAWQAADSQASTFANYPASYM